MSAQRRLVGRFSRQVADQPPPQPEGNEGNGLFVRPRDRANGSPARVKTATEMTLDALAARCGRETEQYYRGSENDPGFCLEMFRRAIVEHRDAAWTLIFEQYEALVSGWTRHHSAFPASGEEVSYFVNRAFEKLILTMTPEKFGRKVTTLGGLLSYLKMCVASVILDHVRAAHQVESIDDEHLARLPGNPSPERNLSSDMAAAELWQAISGLANDPLELKVLRAAYVLDMKAREIFETYVDEFESVNEVYRIKERFLKRLRRDKELEQFIN